MTREQFERLVEEYGDAAGKCEKYDGDLGTNEVEDRARAALLAAFAESESRAARLAEALDFALTVLSNAFGPRCADFEPECMNCKVMDFLPGAAALAAAPATTATRTEAHEPPPCACGHAYADHERDPAEGMEWNACEKCGCDDYTDAGKAAAPATDATPAAKCNAESPVGHHCVRRYDHLDQHLDKHGNRWGWSIHDEPAAPGDPEDPT